MWIVTLAAFGVGGATMLGGVLGAVFPFHSKRLNGVVFAFAGGVMFAAGVYELIIPAFQNAGTVFFFVCILSLLAGGGAVAASGKMLDRAGPHLFRRFGVGDGDKNLTRKVLLFLIAMAVHNLPEGIAAGVGFGTENLAGAAALSAGIALQNLPEGMILVPPLRAIGVPAKKAAFLACMTGVVEIVGTYLGFFAAKVSKVFLPPVLSAAAGAMLYIICADIQPEAAASAGSQRAGFGFLFGFCSMLLVDRFL